MLLMVLFSFVASAYTAQLLEEVLLSPDLLHLTSPFMLNLLECGVNTHYSFETLLLKPKLFLLRPKRPFLLLNPKAIFLKLILRDF